MKFYLHYKVPARVECFPIQTVHETPESDVLYPSYRGQAAHGLNLRECAVIHESPMDLGSGKMQFALCGLRKFPADPRSLRLEIVEVFLAPDGSVSLTSFGPNEFSAMSSCIGLSRHGRGVALMTRGLLLVFVLDYHGPGFISFRYSLLEHEFSASELLSQDAFGGTAFFSRRSSHRTNLWKWLILLVMRRK